MEREIAKFLAGEVLRQYKELPLKEKEKITLNEERLVKIISTIPIKSESVRMRFFSPLPETECTFYDSAENSRRTLQIIGVMTNYKTNYQPSYLIRKFREKEEKFEISEKLENPEEISISVPKERILCRKIRDDEAMMMIREESLCAGNRYSIFAEYSAYRTIKKSHTGGGIWWKMPLAFVPGADKKDLRKIVEICLKYQVPAAEVSNNWFNNEIFLSGE